jgi:hypothetical protein
MRAILRAIILGGVLLNVTYSQEIDWSLLTFSVTGQWIAPQKEFGAYWNNGPALGVYADVPVRRPLFLSASGILSTHSVAETPRKSGIPHVVLVQLGGGLSLLYDLSASVHVGLTAHLVNNTFIFSGPAARPGFENAMESEFGFSLTALLAWKSGVLPPIVALASYQPILVGLEPVAIVSVGLGVRIE